MQYEVIVLQASYISVDLGTANLPSLQFQSYGNSTVGSTDIPQEGTRDGH